MISAETFSAALSHLTPASAVRRVMSFYLAGERTAQARDAAASALFPSVESARAAARRLGARYLAAEASRNGIATPIALPAARTYVAEHLAAGLAAVERDNPSAGVAEFLAVVDRHVTTAARQVVEDAPAVEIPERRPAVSPFSIAEDVEDDEESGLEVVDPDDPDALPRNLAADDEPVQPIGWARELGPKDNHCAFCVTLATRGPVYSSAEEAGGEEVPGVEQYVNRYHDNCACRVVPVFAGVTWIGSKRRTELLSFYGKATKADPKNSPFNAVRNAMAQFGSLDEAIENRNKIQTPEQRKAARKAARAAA